MKNDEFKRWFAHHVARFPGVSTWLRKFPQVGTDEEVTQKSIMAAWRDALAPVELGDAVDASDMLFDGRESRPPAYEAHPSTVRSLAFKLKDARTKKTSRPVPVNGDPREPACKTCLDAGLISCWHPTTVAAFAAGERPPKYTCAKRCDCPAADRMCRDIPPFDPQHDISVIQCPTGDDLARAVETRVGGLEWEP